MLLYKVSPVLLYAMALYRYWHTDYNKSCDESVVIATVL